MSPDARDSVTLVTLTFGGLLIGGPVGALIGSAMGHTLGGAAVGALLGSTLGGLYASGRLTAGDAPLFPSRNV